MKLTSSAIAKQTGERAAKVLVPARRTCGPIESELRTLFPTWESFSDASPEAWAVLRDARVRLRLEGTLSTNERFAHDILSEAIEAAGRLGI